MSRPKWTGEERSIRETALAGNLPRPGTKAHLVSLASTVGWDPDDFSKQALERTRERLIDIRTEKGRGGEPKVDSLVTQLRKAGMTVDPVIRETPRTGWLDALWDSLTVAPWWLAAEGGARTLMLVAMSVEKAERASALFLYDLWSSTGSRPQRRMPVFRRLNLAAVESSEALAFTMKSIGENTDVLFLSGGLLDSGSVYRTLSSLSAVRSLFRGYVVYEAVVPQGEDSATLLSAAKRSGIHDVVGAG